MNSMLNAMWPSINLLLLGQGRIVTGRYLQLPLGRQRLLERREFLPEPGIQAAEDEAGAMAALLGSALTRLRQARRPGIDDTWYLGLPLSCFSLVHFSLPSAAAGDLDAAVHLELMRHLPFDPADCHLQYVPRLDGEQLDIEATVVLKTDVDPLAERFQEAGLELSAVLPGLALMALLQRADGLYLAGGLGATELLVLSSGRLVASDWNASAAPDSGRTFLLRSGPLLANVPLAADAPLRVWQPDLLVEELAELTGRPLENAETLPDVPESLAADLADCSWQVGLVSPAVRRRRRRAGLLQVAALVLLLLSLLSLPVARVLGHNAQLAALDQSITELRGKAEKLSKLREHNHKMVADLRALANKLDSRGDTVEALRELTDILPKDVFLSSFSLQGEQLDIRGEAVSATSIIETLENSPVFKDARFDSQVTRRGDREIFKALAKLR